MKAGSSLERGDLAGRNRVRRSRILSSYGILLIAFVCFIGISVSAQALPPVVEHTGFQSPAEPGAQSVSIVSAASCDSGTVVTGIEFSVVGVSAPVLVAEYGGGKLPATAESLGPALASILAGNKQFLHEPLLTGSSTGNPNEYSVTVAVPGGVPADAVFIVGAVATDGTGARSLERKDLLVVNTTAPSIGSLSLGIAPSDESTYIIYTASLPNESDVAGVRFTIRGYSASKIRAAYGVLEKSEQLFSGQEYVKSSSVGQTDFSGSLELGENVKLPADGLVLLEAEAVDWSGNRRSMSEVFYIADVLTELEFTGISVSPSTVVLTGFGATVQLVVTGTLAGGGTVDVASHPEAIYDVSDPSVASVVDGLVTALGNGTAVVTVDFRGYQAVVNVSVDGAAKLEGIEVGPSGLVLDRVGANAQLIVQGRFSNGQRFDISEGRFGTEYTSSLPLILDVDEDGLVTSYGVGKASVMVKNGSYSSSVEIEVRDGPPTVKLIPSSTSVREGDTLKIKAEVEDDLGLAGLRSVLFLVDGRPLYTDEIYPFEFSIQVPSGYAGKTIKVQARATDIGENVVTSDEISINILTAADTTAPALELLSPPSGARVVAGVVMLLRATTGVDGEMLERVEFTVDGGVVGSTMLPRFLERETGETDPMTGQPEKELLPVWETSYVVRKEYAGRSMIVGARGYDRNGNLATADGVIIRVIEDRPPKVTVDNPKTGSEVIAGRDLTVRVSVHDDLMVYGGTVKAYIGRSVENLESADNLVYSGKSGSGSAPLSALSDIETSGTTRTSFTYRVPSGSGRKYYLLVKATDSGGNTGSSDLVEFTARSNSAPSVYISWPIAGTELTAGDITSVRAVATDDGLSLIHI